MHAWRARADGTATDAQRDMVQAQADGLAEGNRTMADARVAMQAGTATVEQKDLVQALANTNKTRVDAWAAVGAGTATEEQRDLVQAQAENLAAGAKAMKAKSVAAAVAAGKPMRRCNGAACTKIGPEGRQHKHYANGQEKCCGRYRLPV